MTHMLFYVFLIIILVFADQMTKWLATILLKGQPSFDIIPGVFRLTYVENTGAAFGILKDHRWVFLILSSVAIVLICVYLFAFKPQGKFYRVTLVLIIAGGIGNMIDRIISGYVVDFFDFCLINFAVFNVADSCITVGAILLLVYVIFFDKKMKPAALKAEKTPAVADGAPASKNENGEDKNGR